MFYQLVIDAIANDCYIYLLSDHNIVDVLKFKNEKNLSTNLMTQVDVLFKRHKFDYTLISKIYWVYGPGKFSSSRIVSVFAKTLKTISHNLSILVLDKFLYLANNNKSLVVLESDANKYFICFVENGSHVNKPMLIDKSQLDQILNIPNQDYEIIFDNDNFNNVLNVIDRFQLVDEDYTLEYFKPVISC